jgi:hypothetical protein
MAGKRRRPDTKATFYRTEKQYGERWSLKEKRRHARLICEKKRHYHSAADAVGVLAEIPNGHLLEPYLCKWCDRWHVGHPIKQLVTAI